MTDQIKAAATEYPDELRVVMETAGWWLSVDKGWMQDATEDRIRCIYIAERDHGKLATGHPADDADAIVAALTWLLENRTCMQSGDDPVIMVPVQLCPIRVDDEGLLAYLLRRCR